MLGLVAVEVQVRNRSSRYADGGIPGLEMWEVREKRDA